MQAMSVRKLLLTLATLCGGSWLFGCATAEDAVLMQASLDLACRQTQLSFTSLAGEAEVGQVLWSVETDTHFVSGCGQSATYRCMQTSITSVYCMRVGKDGGLAGPLREQRVRAKAARRLGCDAAALVVSAGQDGVLTAAGCGRAIDYDCFTRPDCCAFETPGVLTRDGVAAVQQAQGDGNVTRTGARTSADQVGTQRLSEFIESATPLVRTCYEPVRRAALAHNGRVVVELAVAPDGEVETARVTRSSLQRADVEACVARAIRGLRLPMNRDAIGNTVLSVPIELRTFPPYQVCR